MTLSSSHFIGELMPFLHAHRRRVPAQNVDRSIVVGMGTESAGDADEACLALAASTVYGSAARTRLRSVSGINFDERPAALFEFVGQEALESIPTLGQDRVIEGGLRSDIAAGLFYSAGSRRNHISDIEILEDCGAETIGNVERGPVRPIRANAHAPSGNLAAPAQSFVAAPRPALLPGEPTLGNTALSIQLMNTIGDGKVFSSRKGNCIRNATIYANSRQNAVPFVLFYFASKRYVPAACASRNGHIFYLASERARVPELHPSNFGEARDGPFRIELSDTHLHTLKTEGIAVAFLLRLRIPALPSVESSKHAIEIAKGLCLACIANCGNPIKLRPQICQLAALGCKADGQTFSPLKLTPPVPALLEGKVIDEAANTSELSKQFFLLIGWIEPVSKAAIDHPIYFTSEASNCKVQS